MAACRRPLVQYNHWIEDGTRKGWHALHQPYRIILHDTESHDTAGLRDISGVCNYWDNQNLGLGAHILVDKDGNSGQYVPEHFMAYHTLGHNTDSLGLEMIGFARFGKAIWLARPAQLNKTAKWLAYWSMIYDIPLVKDVHHGVSTHKMQSDAYGGDHWDPGYSFPFFYVLYKARQYKEKGW